MKLPDYTRLISAHPTTHKCVVGYSNVPIFFFATPPYRANIAFGRCLPQRRFALRRNRGEKWHFFTNGIYPVGEKNDE